MHEYPAVLQGMGIGEEGQQIGAVARGEGSGRGDDLKARVAKSLCRARHVPGMGDEVDAPYTCLLEHVVAQARILPRVVRSAFRPLNRHGEFILQYSFHLRCFGEVVSSRSAAGDQDRFAGCALQYRGEAKALQGLLADRIAAIFRRAEICAAA